MPPYCDDCGTHHTIKEGHRARRVLVPDGMTVEDAQQALTEHVAWVPLSEAFPDDTPIPDGTRVRSEWIAGKVGTRRGYVHPEDVPTESADLIEAVAATLWGRGWETIQDESTRGIYRDKARAALAVVREHEATR